MGRPSHQWSLAPLGPARLTVATATLPATLSEAAAISICRNDALFGDIYFISDMTFSFTKSI
jgi:hypothetical protein